MNEINSRKDYTTTAATVFSIILFTLRTIQIEPLNKIKKQEQKFFYFE